MQLGERTSHPLFGHAPRWCFERSWGLGETGHDPSCAQTQLDLQENMGMADLVCTCEWSEFPSGHLSRKSVAGVRPEVLMERNQPQMTCARSLETRVVGHG